MATNVIHGEGTPRFIISSGVLISDTIADASSTSIELTAGADLVGIERDYGLVGRRIYTEQPSGAVTMGVISGYSESPDILQVEEWTNGTPEISIPVTVKDVQLDLPYCQQLQESFTPDFITKKMFSGNIIRIKRGFYYAAQLDYSQYMNKTNLSLLRYLYRNDTGIITFYPRSDNTRISYIVDIEDAEFMFNQIQKFQGHRGVQINLIGLRRLTEAQIYDLAGTTGYGVDYGTNYGTNF